MTWSGVELLWSGRELTTKVGNNLGLSSYTVPRSAVMYVVTYFRKTVARSSGEKWYIDKSEDRTHKRC